MLSRYDHAAPVPETIAKALDSFPPLLQQLFWRRGIETKNAAEAFLNPRYEEELIDPLLLHDMEKACDVIERTMADNGRIAIFSDYDCDGIPGAVILYDFFRAISFTNFQNYIPHRHYEGFGLSTDAVEKLSKDGVALIITVDCGTNDVAAIARANELGIQVIVTDHHEPPAKLPPAAAIVNPKLGDYPFADLCGAAVAFKLVQALIKRGSFSLTSGREKWWLDMVGIATIADMVPLIGENRVFASYGLTVLRKSRRPGLQQLFRKVRVDQRYLSEEDIGFTIGPRINAASRMDAPERAFFMLTTEDEGEAASAVTHLESLNNERKGAVAAMTRELHGRIKSLETLPDVIVLGNPLWRPALVGLAANKLAEEYGRPTFLWGKDGTGMIKGSCRSGGDVSVVKLMEAAHDQFHEYGGHHMSGGFSVTDEGVFTLSEALNEAFFSLGEAATVRDMPLVDGELLLHDVRTTYSLIEPLSPFGTGNPKPLFLVSDVTPKEVSWFGKGQEHLKLLFETKNGKVEAIAFFANGTVYGRTPEQGMTCTLLAHLERSYFMGRQQLRLRIVDIL